MVERAAWPNDRLVTIVIDTDLDVVGDEAILLDGLYIGHVTSGGFAHHAGASVATGYVGAGLAWTARRCRWRSTERCGPPRW